MEKTYQKEILYPDLLWKRPVHYYKSQAGKIFLLAGSRKMSGSAILTAEAIFRSGTGMLTMGFPESLKDIYAEVLPEAMTLPLSETPSHSISKEAEKEVLEQSKSNDVLVVGPGLTTNAETAQLVWQLLDKAKIPIVLDADGFEALCVGIKILKNERDENYLREYFKKRKSALILTPHPGEAAKILKSGRFKEYEGKKISGDFVEKNKQEVAKFLSETLSAIVVLKGYDTTIASPDGRLIIDKIGGPELSVAGTGDVLSGIVGSFVGQNKGEEFKAASVAVYLHGKAGKMAKEKKGERSVIATDIIRFLPDVIKNEEEKIDKRKDD